MGTSAALNIFEGARVWWVGNKVTPSSITVMFYMYLLEVPDFMEPHPDIVQLRPASNCAPFSGKQIGWT